MQALTQYFVMGVLCGALFGVLVTWPLVKRHVERELAAQLHKEAEAARERGPSWVDRTFWADPGIRMGAVRIDKQGRVYNV